MCIIRRENYGFFGRAYAVLYQVIYDVSVFSVNATRGSPVFTTLSTGVTILLHDVCTLHYMSTTCANN